jgi:hypothetical protein
MDTIVLSFDRVPVRTLSHTFKTTFELYLMREEWDAAMAFLFNFSFTTG